MVYFEAIATTWGPTAVINCCWVLKNLTPRIVDESE
jgi:hypothetical protein